MIRSQPVSVHEQPQGHFTPSHAGAIQGCIHSLFCPDLPLCIVLKSCIGLQIYRIAPSWELLNHLCLPRKGWWTMMRVQEKIDINWKPFFSVGTVKHSRTLPKEVMPSPSLEDFKTWAIWSDPRADLLGTGGWTTDLPRSFSIWIILWSYDLIVIFF